MSELQPYNLTLPSTSPLFTYAPTRDGYWAADGNPGGGWRSSFHGVPSQWPAPSMNNWIDGAPYQETNMSGASVTLSFEGSGLCLCLVARNAQYALSVNSTPAQYLTYSPPHDPACSMLPNETGTMLMLRDIPYGKQEVQLVLQPLSGSEALGAGAGLEFYGATVTLGMNGTYADEVWVEDTDSGWVYSRDWTSDPSNPYASANSLHTSCTYSPSSTASYTFTNASAVRLLGQTSIEAGVYTVLLTDGAGGNVTGSYNASSFWTTPQAVLFAQAGLNASEGYTLTLINYDPQDPTPGKAVIGTEPGNQTCITVDALVLTRATPVPPSTGGGVSTGAVVGGVVAVVVILVALFVAWKWMKRRRAHARAARAAASQVDDGMEDALEASRAEPVPFFLGVPIWTPHRRQTADSTSRERLLLRRTSRSRSSTETERRGAAPAYDEPPPFEETVEHSASPAVEGTAPPYAPPVAGGTSPTGERSRTSTAGGDLGRALSGRTQRTVESEAPPEYTPPL